LHKLASTDSSQRARARARAASDLELDHDKGGCLGVDVFAALGVGGGEAAVLSHLSLFTGGVLTEEFREVDVKHYSIYGSKDVRRRII